MRNTNTFLKAENDYHFAVSKYSKSKAFAWMSRRSFQFVDEVQQNCSDVIKQMGLPLFKNAQLYGNFSVSTFLDSFQ